MQRRGAFLDEKGIRWDPNDADYESVVMKQSKWIGEWRMRYLIMKGPKVFFAKSEDATPHGIIDLTDCVSVKESESNGKKNAFEINLRNEKFVLVCDNQRTKHEWITRINKKLGSLSNIFEEDILYRTDEVGFDPDDSEEGEN